MAIVITRTTTGAWTYTVPAGVYTIQLQVDGAGGGRHTGQSTYNGGVGGRITVKEAVTPGQQFTFEIGQAGGNTPDHTAGRNPDEVPTATNPPAYYHRYIGGQGGWIDAVANQTTGKGGAAGGSATVVRSGGTVDSPIRMVVGGGGGGTWNSHGGNGTPTLYLYGYNGDGNDSTRQGKGGPSHPPLTDTAGGAGGVGNIAGGTGDDGRPGTNDYSVETGTPTGWAKQTAGGRGGLNETAHTPVNPIYAGGGGGGGTTPGGGGAAIDQSVLDQRAGGGGGGGSWVDTTFFTETITRGSGRGAGQHGQVVITEYHPPSAPTHNGPASGSTQVLHPTNYLKFDWSPNNAGETQTGWGFRRRRVGGAWEYWNASTLAWQATEVVNTTSPGTHDIYTRMGTGASANSTPQWDRGTWEWAALSRTDIGTSPWSTPWSVVIAHTVSPAASTITGSSDVTAAGKKLFREETDFNQGTLWTWKVPAGVTRANFTGFAGDGGGTLGGLGARASFTLEGLVEGQEYKFSLGPKGARKTGNSTSGGDGGGSLATGADGFEGGGVTTISEVPIGGGAFLTLADIGGGGGASGDDTIYGGDGGGTKGLDGGDIANAPSSGGFGASTSSNGTGGSGTGLNSGFAGSGKNGGAGGAGSAANANGGGGGGGGRYGGGGAASGGGGGGGSTFVYSANSAKIVVSTIQYKSGGNPFSDGNGEVIITYPAPLTANLDGSSQVTVSGYVSEQFRSVQSIPSAEAFGTAGITSQRTVGGIAGIASAEAFGTSTINRGSVTVTATGIASAEALGATTVTLGPATATVTSILSQEAFGTAKLVYRQIPSPPSIPSAEAFGATTVTPAPRTLSGIGGIDTAQAIPNPSVTRGPVTAAPSGIPSAEAVGTPGMGVGSVTVTTPGIPSAEAFGITSVARAPVQVAPAGIDSAEAFGTSRLSVGPKYVTGAGNIASAEAVGIVNVTRGAVSTSPTGIASAEAFGVAHIKRRIAAVGNIASAEAHGTPSVLPGNYTIRGVGAITSTLAFGVLSIVTGEGVVPLRPDDREPVIVPSSAEPDTVGVTSSPSSTVVLAADNETTEVSADTSVVVLRRPAWDPGPVG